jgi:hypothetical protein
MRRALEGELLELGLDRPPLRPSRPRRTQAAIKLLDALNAPEFNPWTLVDARWTSKEPARVSPEIENDG